MKFAPGELNAKLEEAGYIKEIENAMRDFKENHIHNALIYGVFLTGGASRMDFIKPLISKVWNIPEESIHRDQDPSLTISQGVAEVARLDLRTEGMDTGIGEEIDNIIQGNKVYDSFIAAYGDVLKADVVDSVNFSLNYFIGNVDIEDYEECDFSLNDLKEILKTVVASGVDEIKKEAPKYFESAFMETTQEVRGKIDTIVANYTNRGTKVSLPQMRFDSIDIQDINLNSVINEISKNIDISSTNWLQYGLAGAGWIFGPIGAGLGFLLGHFLGGDNRSDKEKQADAMRKALNHDERVEVYNAIVEKSDEITVSIHNAVDKSLRNLSSTIQIMTAKVLNEYKKSLQDARILID